MRVKQRRLFLTLGGLAVGIGLGLLVSVAFFSPDRATTDTTPKAVVSPPSQSDDVNNEKITPVPTNLASVLELDTASARRLALYELLEHKSGEQIAELLRHSFTIGNTKQLTPIQNLLFAALARFDPELSLEIVWRAERKKWEEFLTTVFREWASADLQRSIQIGSELDEPWKSKAFRTIFQIRQDLSDSERADLAASFGAARVLKELALETQIDEVIDEPKAAFELILQSDIPDFRKSQMAARITERWIETEDINNIGSMLNLVYEMFSIEQYQWRVVVSTLASTDPQLAWEQLSTLSLDAQKLLNDEVFKAWVKLDPNGALSALNESDYMATERWELNSLYALWASAVWQQLPEKIDLVPVDHRSSMLTTAVRALAPQIEPLELLEQLRQLQGVGVNTTSTIESYFMMLSDKDPVAALQWAGEYLDEGSFVFSTILRELAVVDLTRAMEFALQQPESTGMEQSVVQTMFTQGWLEKGLELLPKVRPGTSVMNLYVSAGALLIENGRISEAIELAIKLPEEEQSEYFVNLSGIRSYTNSFLFVQILPQLPSEEIRALVAERMLRTNNFIGTLTDDEIEIVRSYLQATIE
ncbi:MAG: hypothetical protein F4W92_06285 [Gammaproteobacteria bacterium]|nr:hypothetical protein [Gammaproteobacteria bacterium]